MGKAGPAPLATLRLFSDHLDPTVVDRTLNTQADVAALKGDNLYPKSDRTRVLAKTGTWFITTRDRLSSDRPADHLAWLVDLLWPRLDILRSQISDLQADLSLLVHGRRFTISELPGRLLAKAVQIGELEIEAPDQGFETVITSLNWREAASSAAPGG